MQTAIDPVTSLVEAAGVTIGASDLCLAFKLGRGRGLLDRLVGRRIAASLAETAGLDVDDADVDRGLGRVYADLDLFEPEQIEAWLAATRVEADELRATVREELLAARFAEHVADEAALTNRFQARLYDHGRLEVELIDVETESIARELIIAMHEMEISWADAVARAGGSSRVEMRRSEAPEAAAAALWAAGPDTTVGPVETGTGSFAIYRVHARSAPVLDDELRARLRNEIVGEHLDRALARQPLRFTR